MIVFKSSSDAVVDEVIWLSPLTFHTEPELYPLSDDTAKIGILSSTPLSIKFDINL